MVVVGFDSHHQCAAGHEVTFLMSTMTVDKFHFFRVVCVVSGEWIV
jgi:hypothetical protein